MIGPPILFCPSLPPRTRALQPPESGVAGEEQRGDAIALQPLESTTRACVVMQIESNPA